MKFKAICLAFTIVLLVAAASSPVRAEEDSSDQGVFPPNLKVNGNTYAEWSALWWRYFFAIPAGRHPLNGGDCGIGQVGSVWFLVAGPSIVHCTIPSGKLLFFPVLNSECSNLEDPPFFGATQAARRACAKSIIDDATNLTATLDGKPIAGIKGRFRASSPNFTFVVPPNNVYGLDPAFGQAVSDGYHLMLRPLAAGKHIIRVTGSLPAFEYDLDTTFELNVR